MAASQCQVHGGRIGFGSRPTAPALSAAGFVRVEGAAGCCYGASASAVVVGGGLGGALVASSSSSSGIGVVVLVVSPAFERVKVIEVFGNHVLSIEGNFY